MLKDGKNEAGKVGESEQETAKQAEGMVDGLMGGWEGEGKGKVETSEDKDKSERDSEEENKYQEDSSEEKSEAEGEANAVYATPEDRYLVVKTAARSCTSHAHSQLSHSSVSIA